MVFVSIHTMDGDPQELIRRKEAELDPILDELAPAYGALLSITGSTARGIVVVNVWESAVWAEEFRRHPVLAAAQARSGLPTVVVSQSLENVTIKDYLAP